MSALIHHDLPKPGRFSLSKVCAARLGHARRRAKSAVEVADEIAAATIRERFPDCDGACEAGRSACACKPAMSKTEQRREPPPEPLTRKELAQFWAIASAPAIALLGVAGFYIWTRFGHVW